MRKSSERKPAKRALTGGLEDWRTACERWALA